MKKLYAIGLLILSACATTIPTTTSYDLADARRVKPLAPSFTIACGTVAEEAGNASCTITKSGSNGKSSIISYQTQDRVAVAPGDYTAVNTSVTFSSTTTVKQISVAIVDDTNPEPTETFGVAITAGSNARLGNTAATITITDSDAASAPTKLCWDGTTVPVDGTCPSPPVSTGYVESPSLKGAADNIGNFDVSLALGKSWGTGAIPGLYAADGSEGAFRFTCGGEGQILNDDPMLYPGQPGASHTHKFSGPSGVTGDTTIDQLATMGSSNCNYGTYVVNHSSYWMPCLINASNRCLNPDWEAFYYKSFTLNSRFCRADSATRMGVCINLPNKLRFIYGWDPTNPNAAAQGMDWYCSAGTGAHYTNLNDIFNVGGCTVGATLIAELIAPPCWDGKYLDTPNHRDHLAHGSYGSWGYYKCPATHPYVIPAPQTKKAFIVTSDMIGTNPDGSKYSRIGLSSDHMKSGALPGETMHADYWEGWDARVKTMWYENCVLKALDCSGGDLGNGLQILGASQPSYGWTNPTPTSPVP